MAAAQDVELTQKQLTGEIVPLKFVKFQNVQVIPPPSFLMFHSVEMLKLINRVA